MSFLDELGRFAQERATILGKNARGVAYHANPFDGGKTFADSWNPGYTPKPIDPSTDPNYPRMKPELYLHATKAKYATAEGVPDVTYRPRVMTMRKPNRGLRVHQGRQQPSGPYYEDTLTPTQAIQPTGFSNQPSLNGRFIQGSAINELLNRLRVM